MTPIDSEFPRAVLLPAAEQLLANEPISSCNQLHSRRILLTTLFSRSANPRATSLGPAPNNPFDPSPQMHARHARGVPPHSQKGREEKGCSGDKKKRNRVTD
ncbi:hypothetical protein CDAR_549181 [Caerostris darwini]|uniref:Uncharacterized protein n=1 Tax=Caerostris darwini TaxID=1538125 RepID=A0AAV4WME0_9ARAC|nr:hypothetical protein CDAR_549181 [Caerostris darwini]